MTRSLVPKHGVSILRTYLVFSLMLGAIAGILAGLVIGPMNFDPHDVKTGAAVVLPSSLSD